MLIEVALSTILAASGRRCGPGEHTFSADSSGDRIMFTASALAPTEPKLLHSASLEAALADDLALVTEVRHVFVERAEDNLLVWIAIDSPTREVREKVFQKQFDLIDGFPEISFDFNLIPAKDRDFRSFASSAKLIYSREA